MELTEDLAKEEFLKWADANEIDTNVDKMTDEDKSKYEDLTSKIIKSIQKGVCVVDGDKLEYTLTGYEGAMDNMKIKVSPPTGKMYLGMDGYKQTQEMHKMFGAMSAVCGVDVGVFGKMKAKDLKFFQNVIVLFLTA